MKKIALLFYVALTLMASGVISSCNKNDKTPAVKSSPADPFNKTMVESTFFDLDQMRDTVLEGKNGTMIAVPHDAFVDENGDVVTFKVKLELAQPETFDEVVLSNLSTQAERNTLDSKGMFFMNASSEGKPLFINSRSSIYMEMASGGGKEDVMLFKGKRDAEGKMSWTEPRPVIKYLVPVALSELDFLPTGFANEVKEGTPFRKHTVATQPLTDSLYYSLAVPVDNLSELEFSKRDRSPSEIAKIDSLVAKPAFPKNCGIDPATIKTLKEKRFENTLISTREFEKRLGALHKICDNTLVELYVNNLGKNLWEIDKMVAEMLESDPTKAKIFNDFAAEKLTNVEKMNRSADQLSLYYNSQLKKIKEELKKLEDEAVRKRVMKDELAATKKQEYKELLVKREKYRMDKFGFKLDEFGWHNAAVYIEDLEKFTLEVTVKNGKDYDRVNTYIFNPKIKSLFAMVSDDKTLFNRGYWDDKFLLMWKHQEAEAIVVAYKGEQAYFEKQVWTVYTVDEKPNILSFDPKPVSENELRKLLKGDVWSTHENKIKVDLEYQAFFYKEEQRQNTLRDEAAFLLKLRKLAYSCCYPDGETLFKMNCATCHTIGRGRLTGPDLLGVSSRIPSEEWFVLWVKDSQKLIHSGDPYARKISEENNLVPQPAFTHLSDEEIRMIYDYINAGPVSAVE